jgi:hypothetical protein
MRLVRPWTLDAISLSLLYMTANRFARFKQNNDRMLNLGKRSLQEPQKPNRTVG